MKFDTILRLVSEAPIDDRSGDPNSLRGDMSVTSPSKNLIQITGTVFLDANNLRQTGECYIFQITGYHKKRIGTIHIVSHTNPMVITIKGIYIIPEYRRRGISDNIYLTFLKQKYVIKADENHYPAGKRLWERLFYHPRVQIRCINRNKQITYDITSIQELRRTYDIVIDNHSRDNHSFSNFSLLAYIK